MPFEVPLHFGNVLTWDIVPEVQGHFKHRTLQTCASRKTSAIEGKVLVRYAGREDLATQAAFEISSSRCGVRSRGFVYSISYHQVCFRCHFPLRK